MPPPHTGTQIRREDETFFSHSNKATGQTLVMKDFVGVSYKVVQQRLILLHKKAGFYNSAGRTDKTFNYSVRFL